MSEGTWKARILMEGLGRVNLPHFCASEAAEDGGPFTPVLSPPPNLFLPHLIPFCYYYWSVTGSLTCLSALSPIGLRHDYGG